MKTKINFNHGSLKLWSTHILKIKKLILSALIFAGMLTTLQAQETQYTRPAWRFGVAAGANLNFYRGSTQELNYDITVPAVFNDGFGVGLYAAPLLEYHHPESILGFMLQAGFDSRRGAFDQITNPCYDCPADLSTDLSYISVEPSLRLAPFKSNFYLFAGPRFAFNLGKSFKYELGIDPSFPDQEAPPIEEGEFSNIYKSLISMQIGTGIDIPLSSRYKQSQAILSPFVSFHPYYNQDPRSIETWNVTTFRIGAALKFGRGREIAPEVVPAQVVPAQVVPVEPEVEFIVYSPRNIPVERRVRETFPLRNYVFFDLGSTEIPDRYVLLSRDQVAKFKVDQLEVFRPVRLSGRSDRQMIVYYNVLNILGDRLGSNPSASVMLTGSSREGIPDGLAMAESVKNYLVTVFGINASRINTEGQIRPSIPSEQVGGTRELALLREEDRRVSIWSDSPALMMEFQSGPDAPLKPVEITDVQVAPLDSYITFSADGAIEAFSSWSLEVRDEKGSLQRFGPYTQERISIPGRDILGSRPSGDYKVTMVGQTKSGRTVTKEVPVNMVLWTPAESEMGMRYSIVFEFDDPEAIASYVKYLTDIVTPKVPRNGTVIIHGYTDIIGSEERNLELSLARANDAGDIIKSALSGAGRSDVKFEIYGFGEDQNLSPFANDTPEERFYNRSVIIDIIPPK